MYNNKIIKNIILSVTIFLVFVTSIVTLPTKSFAENHWENFDVRTKMPSNVTEESIKKVFKEKGHSDSPFYTRIDFILKESKKNGLNPLYILGVMNKESGWGKSKKARNMYAYGGIKNPGGNSGDQSFQNEEDGILGVIYLIRKYVDEGIVASTNPDGKPMRTVKEIGKTYCPSSDGCDEKKYWRDIGWFLEQFGQTMDGSLMSPSNSMDEANDKAKDIKDGDGRSIYWDILYIEHNLATNVQLGPSVGDVPVGNEVGSFIFTESTKVQKLLTTIGVILSSIFFVYSSTGLVIYLVGTGTINSGKYGEKLESILGIPSVKTTDNTKKIMGKFIISLGVVLVFLLGIHVTIMAGIYRIINNFWIF